MDIIKIKFIGTMTGLAFITNLIWENVQAPLYAGYIDFASHFVVCFRATLIDVLIIIGIYGFLALIKRNFWWIKKVSAIDVLSLILIGFIIAQFIELNALQNAKWSYSEAMPLIPLLKVGLTPIFQMMILPLLSFYLAEKFTDTGT